MGPSSTIRCRKSSEEGYLLISVMFLMAILVLWLSVAVPRMTKSIQRDRDVETMERGRQYIRGVQLYYRKFGAYPPSEDALVKTNEIRFLRKRYLDPITGKDDWKPIAFGQNKVPTAMGFFGQPLAAGSSLAGIGPGGGNGLAGANGSPSNGSFFGSNGSSGFGSSSGSSIFGDSGSNASPGSTTPNSTNPGSTNPGSTDNSGNSSAGGSGSSGAGGTSGTGSTSSGFGSGGFGGQTFGGAGVIGFSPASPKQSILIYKKKDHYNEWEFTYDPVMDMKMMSGGNTGTIGQPAGSLNGQAGIPGITTPGTSSTPGTGSNNSTGSTPTLPPDTSAPQ
jgi:type II secretory pathway pseudopilin PulG